MIANRRDRRDAARLWRLCVVDDTIDPDRVRHVVDGILQSNQRRGPAVLSHFLRLLRNGEARHEARVESATSIDVTQRAHIQDTIAGRYGSGVTMTFDVAPALIGGIRVTIGSDVYDGSVRGRLDALADRFGEEA